MQSVDAVIRFLTGLFAGTGLTEDTVITVGAAVALVVVILGVVFALSRRIDRLEESLMDLRQLHSTMRDSCLRIDVNRTQISRWIAFF